MLSIAKILSVSVLNSGGSSNLQTKSVSLTSTSAQTFSKDNAYDGMSSITVTPNLQSKNVSSSTSAQTITPDSGYCRLRQVNISAFSGETITTIYIKFEKSDFTYQNNSYDTTTPHWYQLDSSKQLSFFPSSISTIITSCQCNGQYNNSYSVIFIGGNGLAYCINKNNSTVSNAEIQVFNTSTRQTLYRGLMVLRFNIWDDKSKYNLVLSFDSNGYNHFNQLPSDSEITIVCQCF